MTAWRFKNQACLDQANQIWQRVRWVLLGVILVVIPCFPKEGMDQNARIAIIRGLQGEAGVTKIPLPRGRKGVRVDAQGKLDQAEAQTEMRSNGLAMNAGMPAQITHIEFKSSSIVFELNGGGRSGKKWYQHIEIGAGPMSEPIAQPQQSTVAYGSSVAVDFGKALPNLTVPELKKILAGVLDFERHAPTVLYSPNVTPEVKEAIKNHNVVVGMDRDAVLSAKGAPDRRVREDREGSEQEDWIYGNPPHVLFVTFDGDKVIAVKQF
jgi:hypothetical protein